MKHLLSGALAAVCAVCVSVSAFAASVSPVLSTSSSCMGTLSQYEAIPPEFVDWSLYMKKGNQLFYAITLCRVTDDSGNLYRIDKTAQLADSSVFRKNIEVNTNPLAVKSIVPMENQGDLACLALTLDPDFSLFERTVIEFSITYTALEDTSLEVNTLGEASSSVPLEVKKGAKISCNYRVLIDGETVFL